MRNFTVSGAAPEDVDTENTANVLVCVLSAIFRWELGSMVVRDCGSPALVADALAKTGRMIAIRMSTAVPENLNIMRV